MSETIWLIPLIPFLSSVALMLLGSRLKITHIGVLGVGHLGQHHVKHLKNIENINGTMI